ncbi:hypothetical protein [Leptolyngbya sp. FACHB-261]|uniref:hypothetical protein n=1 Tax=Leptolyngbya sp. FACHB-261 TaxID=2692806 RepID=UPI001688FCAE|nr:hypothetical protein [Leptolyngbya sp. FACHB-261]MBD2101784.1 hypothetical protein [Leptolyngbya sp. FACHB-261]
MSIATGDGGTIQNSAQNLNVDLVAHEFFFDLQVLELNSGEAVLLSPQASLQPEQAYCIRVSRSWNIYRPSPSLSACDWQIIQYPVKIEQELQLTLNVIGSAAEVAAIGTIADQGSCLSRHAEAEWHHDFQFIVQANCSVASVTLELRYRESSANLNKFASSLVLPLESIDSTPAPTAKVYNLPVKAEPPERTAFLHIHLKGQNELSLTGWIRDRVNRPDKLGPITSLQVSPENYSDDLGYLKALQEAINDYAIKNVGDITVWLEKVVDSYGEDCCIVIIDQADSQIPWEMFKLGGGRYLGACVLVVRWAEAYYRNQQVALQLGEAKHTGRVVAYVHSLDSEVTKSNCPILQNLSLKHHTSPEELQDGLLPSSEAVTVGLVYLSCNGVLTYGDEQNVLSKLHNPSNVTVKFRFDDVEGILDPRPVFFANASYSGRLLVHDHQPCGLTQAALTQVAASYIGTLGPVGRLFAAQLAQFLLSAATSSQGMQPAQLLRKLRAEVASRLRNTKVPLERRKRDFLYTFMYVYYGNPKAYLKLTLPSAKPVPSQEAKHG